MHIKVNDLIIMISNKYNINKNKVAAVTYNFFKTCNDNSIKFTTMLNILNDNHNDWKTNFIGKVFDVIADNYPMDFERLYIDF